MAELMQWIQRHVGVTPWLQTKILSSLGVALLIWVFRWVVLKAHARQTRDARVLYRWRKTSAYLGFVLGALIVGRVWFTGLERLSTYLGLLSAGVAIALRDPIVNLAGWVFILWRRPFEVGDRIEIGEHAGDVIDQRIFQFTLMEIGRWVGGDQSTGRVIHVPNGRVFTHAQANYTKGFQYIWDEVAVLVTFESNWKKAKQLLAQIANRRAEHLSEAAEQRLRRAVRRYMILYSKLTPIVYTSVEDCGILLTMRYLCEPRERRGTQQAIWEDVLEEFANCSDVDFAYPTQRFYDNTREGKTGTRLGLQEDDGPGGRGDV